MNKQFLDIIAEMRTDIALIKQCLMGNAGKCDGMIDKVNKHDMYFYIAYGFIIVLGVLYGFKI